MRFQLCATFLNAQNNQRLKAQHLAAREIKIRAGAQLSYKDSGRGLSSPTLCNDVLSTSWKGEGSIRISSISMGLSISASSHALICSSKQTPRPRFSHTWGANKVILLRIITLARGKTQDCVFMRSDKAYKQIYLSDKTTIIQLIKHWAVHMGKNICLRTVCLTT